MDYSRIWKFDREFNGYDLGCGELSLDLKIYFKSLPPAARVLVITGDPGAPIDLPAWCRLTGHTLLDAKHPYYLILKKEFAKKGE
jgi:tRNA 2-thiouridine synthesizing protein A